MNRSDWLTVAQIARLTQIGLRSLWRYLARKGMHRYKRRRTGGRRTYWHRHVIPKLRDEHAAGLARMGKRFGNKRILKGVSR